MARSGDSDSAKARTVGGKKVLAPEFADRVMRPRHKYRLAVPLSPKSGTMVDGKTPKRRYGGV